MPTSHFDIAFLFMGGAHQVLHTAPAAAELSCDKRFYVVCVGADADARATVEQVIAAWPEARAKVEMLPAPAWGKWAARLRLARKTMKRPRLLHHRRKLAQYDAIVTAERTSTILKSWNLSPACLIHIPHGAGDRAKGFEPRIRLFDYVIVSGQKDADRMIAEGLVRSDNCAVSGSVKLGAVERLSCNRPRFFNNDRPVVLYNPHFSEELSSWSRWGREIIAAFAAQDEYNLIVAPHVRLFEGASEAEKAAIEALSIPDRILIDTGSPRSCNMSYTLAADIYVGDVSSQVYEFLSRPRPCVFLNSTGVAWENDPNYAFWQLGDVVGQASDLLLAVQCAETRHQTYLPLQQQATARALGTGWASAPARAAQSIRTFLVRQAVAQAEKSLNAQAEQYHGSWIGTDWPIPVGRWS
jgi:hypothetical protein